MYCGRVHREMQSRCVREKERERVRMSGGVWASEERGQNLKEQEENGTRVYINVNSRQTLIRH